jgi:cytoskeletal protein RodZ
MDSIGHTLRSERQLKQLSLEELAQTTRIPLKSLQQIEADEFADLPGDVFVRGFVRSYAKALGVDSAPLLDRFEADRQQQDQLDVVGLVGEPERARRVGVAVAMIILLFLFTLALSIVLRPRRHDRPAELSQAPAQVLDVLETVAIG